MHDILAHSYDRINLNAWWDVIQSDISELIELIASFGRAIANQLSSNAAIAL